MLARSRGGAGLEPKINHPVWGPLLGVGREEREKKIQVMKWIAHTRFDR